MRCGRIGREGFSKYCFSLITTVSKTIVCSIAISTSKASKSCKHTCEYNMSKWQLIELSIENHSISEWHGRHIYCSPMPMPLYTSSSSLRLVRTSRRLTRLKLIQIPPTDSQTTLVIIHALAEAPNIIRTRRTRLGHLRGVGGLVLCAELGGLGCCGFRGGGGPATEPAADCVAD
jgi:hypothetical protein